MARPTVNTTPLDTATAAVAGSITSASISPASSSVILLVHVVTREGTGSATTSVTTTLSNATCTETSADRRDTQGIHNSAVWRIVFSGAPGSGTVTANVADADTNQLGLRIVEVAPSAGGTLSIDDDASADQGATDTTPATVSVVPTSSDVVALFFGSCRVDTFSSWGTDMAGIGSEFQFGAAGDAMRLFSGYNNTLGASSTALSANLSGGSEWIAHGVVVKETGGGGGGPTVKPLSALGVG